MSFVDVREPYTSKLLFRYDPVRQLVEVQRRNVKTVVDLTQYKAPESAEGQHEAGRARVPSTGTD